MVEPRTLGAPGTAAQRVCLIGAGPSGLACLKAFKDRGLRLDCYEQSDKVGGLWAFRTSLGKTSAYRSLHINTSRERTQFLQYPMPAGYPDYPHHSQIAAYLEAYAREFSLLEDVWFNTKVERVRRASDNGFVVQLEGGTELGYDAVLVANGHHSVPHRPAIERPIGFEAPELHAANYVDPREPVELCSKRVVVVGMGNSAMDIACELAYSGAEVTLSARRGAHIIPKWILGKPVDQASLLPGWLPKKLRRRINQSLLALLVGKPQDYGLPAPDHGLGEAHPTLSSELPSLVRSGRITAKPLISRLSAPREVHFGDGSSTSVDAIVYCTGYDVRFPFFDAEFIQAPDNDLPLFLRVHLPEVPNLFFIGLCQPLGAVLPIAEAQGAWVAAQLAGSYRLPPVAEMERQIQVEQRRLAARYVPSRRHTMQLDVDDYLARLAREQAKGTRRAKRGAPERAEV